MAERLDSEQKIKFIYQKTFTTSVIGEGYSTINSLKSNEKQDYGYTCLINGVPDDLSKRQKEELRVDMVQKLSNSTGWDINTIWSHVSVSGIVFIHIKDEKLLKQYEQDFEKGRRGFLPSRPVWPKRD